MAGPGIAAYLILSVVLFATGLSASSSAAAR